MPFYLFHPIISAFQPGKTLPNFRMLKVTMHFIHLSQNEFDRLTYWQGKCKCGEDRACLLALSYYALCSVAEWAGLKFPNSKKEKVQRFFKVHIHTYIHVYIYDKNNHNICFDQIVQLYTPILMNKWQII